MTANNLKPEKLEAITDVRDDLFYVTNAKQKKGGNILGSILGVLVGTALEAAFPSE